MRKVAKVSGLASVVVAYASIALAIAVSPWFTWTGNWLSDLGAHMPSAPIFNLGLIVSGALATVFSVNLVSETRGAGRVGALLLTAGAVSLCLVGALPEPVGRAHLYASVAFFTLSSLALIVLGAAVTVMGKHVQGVMTSLAGVTSAVSMLYPRPWPGGAIPEIIASSMFSAVLVYLSLASPWRARGDSNP